MFTSLYTSMARAREPNNIYDRFERQERRIDRGVDEGLLRPREAERLRDNVHRVQHDFERTWREGYLDRSSMERFNRELDENSREIDRLEHRQGNLGSTIERFLNREFNENR